MKKSLFMLGLAVAAMTSCSNDELMEVNTNNVISFESHVNNGTRAVADTKTGLLEDIYVFGSIGETVIFNNVNVYKDGSNWTYDNPVPWTENLYKFAAYATTNVEGDLTGSSISYNPTSGTLTFSDFSANDANDLVAAVTSVNNTGFPNDQVNFTFQHMLSKVQFELVNKSTDYSMEVSDITFNVVKQGTCVYNGSANWTPATTASSLTFDGTTTKIAKGGTNSYVSEDHLVIPNQYLNATGKEVKASFTVAFYDAGDNKVYEKKYTNAQAISLKLNADDTQLWAPGYSYKYTGEISPATENITFGVTKVEDWTPAAPDII